MTKIVSDIWSKTQNKERKPERNTLTPIILKSNQMGKPFGD